MSRHSTSRGGAGTLDLFDKPAGPLNECVTRQRGKSGADLSDWRRHRVLARGGRSNPPGCCAPPATSGTD
jgi:hypothetical protein